MTQAAVREISVLTVWQLARPASLSLTAVACVLGLASAAGCGMTPDWAGALAALLLACGCHAGVNLLHTWQLVRDAQGSAQLPEPPSGPFSAATGLRLINQGAITPAEVRQVAWALLGLVMLAGLALALKAGGGILLLGLAGLLLAWAHVAPPLRLGNRGGAEVVTALAWWLVVLGADHVQRHHFFVIPAVDAVSFALLAAAVPLAQRAQALWCQPQAPIHRARWLAALYTGLMLLAYGWLVGGVQLLYQPPQALWGLLSLPVSLVATGLLWGAAHRPQRATWAARVTFAGVLLHGVGMAGGLATVAW